MHQHSNGHHLVKHHHSPVLPFLYDKQQSYQLGQIVDQVQQHPDSHQCTGLINETSQHPPYLILQNSLEKVRCQVDVGPVVVGEVDDVEQEDGEEISAGGPGGFEEGCACGLGLG